MTPVNTTIDSIKPYHIQVAGGSSETCVVVHSALRKLILTLDKLQASDTEHQDVSGRLIPLSIDHARNLLLYVCRGAKPHRRPDSRTFGGDAVMQSDADILWRAIWCSLASARKNNW